MTNQEERFCPRCCYREVGNYCEKCGSRLIDISKWEYGCKCGELIQPWEHYCRNCGEELTLDQILDYSETIEK